MDTPLLIELLLLARASLVAGLSRLPDRLASRQALVMDFRVPAPLATPLKILLQPAELAVAVTLIPSGSTETGPA